MDVIRRRYATATVIYLDVYKASGGTLALTADWTPALHDVQLILDGATPVDVGTLPTFVATTRAGIMTLSLTALEVTAKSIVVVVGDAAAKAVLDMAVVVETYGNALAQHPGEFIADGALADTSFTSPGLLLLSDYIANRMWDSFSISNDDAGTFGRVLNDIARSGVTPATVWAQVLAEPTGAIEWGDSINVLEGLAYLLMKVLNTQEHRGTEIAWLSESNSADIATAPVTRSTGVELRKGHDE